MHFDRLPVSYALALGLLANTCVVSCYEDHRPIQVDVVLSPAFEPPQAASMPIANDFVSLSIAIHWFQDYTRIGSQGESGPNVFSRNLLSQLKESTSVAPQIRVGGTSADRTTYIPSQEEPILQVSGNNGIPLNVTVNRKFFQQCFAQENFPSGVKFTFDLAFVRNDSLSLNNTIQGAQWALAAIQEDAFNAFEIGNEEDLYPNNGVVPSNWSVNDYVKKWKIFSEAVTEKVLRPSGLDSSRKWFQGLVFSGLGQNAAWTTETAFNAGVNDDQSLKSVSLHNYPTGNAPWVTLGRTFMSHNAIVANLTQVNDDIAFLDSSPSTSNIDFVLGETNLDFVNLNMDQFEGVLGSALWTIDYILFGASQNIKRMHLHQGTTFGYAAWQPIAVNGVQPKVRAPWYGLKFGAEAIGSHKGPIQIAALDLNIQSTTSNFSEQLLTSDKLSAYAIYESSSIARIAIINFNEWNATTPFSRPNATFQIHLPGQRGRRTPVTGRKLTAPGGASADSDVTFGGVMWNYTTMGLPRRVSGVPGRLIMNVSPADGSIITAVGASEALLIDIN